MSRGSEDLPGDAIDMEEELCEVRGFLAVLEGWDEVGGPDAGGEDRGFGVFEWVCWNVGGGPSVGEE